jgi:hypothetical protein
MSVYGIELLVAEDILGSVTAIKDNEFGSGRDRSLESSGLLPALFKHFVVFVTGSVL